MVAVLVAFAIVLHLQPGSAFTLRAIDDLTETLTALAGGAPCIWRSRRSQGRSRLSWLLLGAALISWGIGQAIWSYYELVAKHDVPFPSFADLGFLLFPVFALTGLLLRPSGAFAGRGRLRVVLDGAMLVGSLLIVSWSTALGAVYSAGAQSTFALAVGLAYPASDVVLLTVAVLVGLRSKPNVQLILLVGGLIAMAIADSSFAYMTAAGTYQTGAFSDVAWPAAFLFIGVSAFYPRAGERQAVHGVGSSVAVVFPYALVLGGAVAEVIALARGTAMPVSLIAAGFAIVALIIRQFLTLLDNRRLAIDVLAQQDELHFRAFHDTLTGLANRALFYDRLRHALELHRRNDRPVSVVFIDLDDFKAVNDVYGHDAGDLVLTEVAARLAAVVRTSDTLARLGGDEFAVLVEDDGDAVVLSQRLQQALAEPLPIGTRDLPVRASIGTATVEPGSTVADLDELLKKADLAMYAAKRSGKGASIAYSADLHESADTDLELRLALAEAISAGRIETAYQPIVRFDGAVFGVEVLARWTHHGVEILPEEFIPLAERCGLLTELDLLMLTNALSMSSVAGHRILVSVNLGLRTADPELLVQRVRSTLHERGLVGSDLVVEVSERDALADSRGLTALEALRDLGASVAVDDFGAGYSNLARLGELRPDIVKVHRRLIGPLGKSEQAARFLGGVINLAHDLGATVIGEGVETQAQFDALCALNCDAVQGYYIAQPTTTPWRSHEVTADTLDVA